MEQELGALGRAGLGREHEGRHAEVRLLPELVLREEPYGSLLPVHRGQHEGRLVQVHLGRLALDDHVQLALVQDGRLDEVNAPALRREHERGFPEHVALQAVDGDELLIDFGVELARGQREVVEGGALKGVDLA